MLHRRANLIGKSIRCTGLFGFALWASTSMTLAAPADGWFSLVHDSEGVQATAYTDCDSSAYAVVSVSERGAAERYAVREKFAQKIAPLLPAIFSAAATWLDGEGGQTCDAIDNGHTGHSPAGVNARTPVQCG